MASQEIWKELVGNRQRANAIGLSRGKADCAQPVMEESVPELNPEARGAKAAGRMLADAIPQFKDSSECLELLDVGRNKQDVASIDGKVPIGNQQPDDVCQFRPPRAAARRSLWQATPSQ
jgi:hypothetical protein